jgi:TetR/AcrR family transcriptional regulator of autoinduction and epiphytic fitness
LLKKKNGLDEKHKIDGRRARSQRSRDAIVKAMLDFVQEGTLRPSAPAIAHRAGVSRRIVFSHFKDLETLRAACIERFGAEERARFWRPIPSTLPLGERLRAFVRQRTGRLEFTTPFRRATLVFGPFSPQIAQGVRAGTARAHDEIRSVFAPEIGGIGHERQPYLIAALILVFSWPAWNLLRTDLGFSPAHARRIVTDMASALIDQEVGTTKAEVAKSAPSTTRES